MNKQAWLV